MATNIIYEVNWRRHSSYPTYGQAKNQADRLSMILGYLTKIEESKTSNGNKIYWLMSSNKERITQKKINYSLEAF